MKNFCKESEVIATHAAGAGDPRVSHRIIISRYTIILNEKLTVIGTIN